MSKIKLTRGFFSLIDSEDLEKVSNHSWCIHKNGKQGKVYAAARINKSLFLLHRFILGINNKKIQIDHINGDTLDNRKLNLRICFQKENLRNSNKHLDSKNKYKGVFYNKRNKNWRSVICKDYKRYEIGSFKTQKEAAKAYDKKAIELFGKFAKLNFGVISEKV